jgi:hypothetical protein
MTKRLTLLAGAILGTAALALGQTSTTNESTQQSSEGSTTTTTRTTFSGPIVSYQAGHTIVLREDGKTVTYTLDPNLEVPSDIAVGRVVTVTTTPDNKMVTRVVTTDTNKSGQPRQTTETREVDSSGNVTTTKETTVYGTVSSFEAGKSITITNKQGKRVTYTVTTDSQLPTSIKVGRKVTIFTIPGAGASEQVVKRVTVTTETNPQ